jgi:hypothetical protein
MKSLKPPLNAQLHDDDVADRQQLPDLAKRARHLRCLLDGYRGSIATGTRFKMQSSAPAMTESIRLVIETPAESATPRIMDSS